MKVVVPVVTYREANPEEIENLTEPHDAVQSLLDTFNDLYEKCKEYKQDYENATDAINRGDLWEITSQMTSKVKWQQYSELLQQAEKQIIAVRSRCKHPLHIENEDGTHTCYVCQITI